MSVSTTAPVLMVTLRMASVCPQCKRRIEAVRTLTEHELTTGNTTQMASYHAKEMRAIVERDMAERGWHVEMCGRCGDPEP